MTLPGSAPTTWIVSPARVRSPADTVRPSENAAEHSDPSGAVNEEDEVVLGASFVDDLNADSLDLVELIMSLEEEFSSDAGELEISDEDAEKIASVQDAVDYLKDHGVEDK